MIIKVCGMCDPENIHCLEDLDIDYMGFIFYPASPRYVTGHDGQINAIRKSKKKKVGVFVNEDVSQIVDIAQAYQLDSIQLHGNESPETCRILRKKGFQIIKALPIASVDDFTPTEAYVNNVDYLLFDTKCAGYGGSGNRFDWSLLREYKAPTPFLLSGGLTADCLYDIKRFEHQQFAGIDLNSGFEISSGVKDVSEIKKFLYQIKK